MSFLRYSSNLGHLGCIIIRYLHGVSLSVTLSLAVVPDMIFE